MNPLIVVMLLTINPGSNSATAAVVPGFVTVKACEQARRNVEGFYNSESSFFLPSVVKSRCIALAAQ